MSRYRSPAFVEASTPRYIVLWDLQWRIIDCQRMESPADLFAEMAVTIDRLTAEGWKAEATPEYGFVCVHRNGERRLLTLTERDPSRTAAQSFNPFRSAI